MYDTLGVAWACSLLGFLSLGLAAIPWVFIWKGDSLRARSKFCQYLIQQEREEEEARERRHMKDETDKREDANKDVEAMHIK